MKQSSPPRLVVLGSSNTDLVLRCARLPQPGETLLGGEFEQHPGGKGANQAVAAVRAGARVTFIGRHGADAYGRSAKAALRGEGIDVRHFRDTRGASSGVALILLGGPTRENLIAVARSANDRVSARDVQAAERAIAAADAVLTSLEVPLGAVNTAARLAAKHGVPFLLNPAPARTLPDTLLRRVDLLTPNESEAALLTGETEPERAARVLLARGCRRVVVTLGVAGALLVDESGATRIPAPRVRAVDTVGAGDCFSAWLAVALAEGREPIDAVRLAVRAAALAVTRRGAQPGMPRRREVRDRA